MKSDTKNLPSYTFKEELVNTITHLIGLVFALGVLIFFIIQNVICSFWHGTEIDNIRSRAVCPAITDILTLLWDKIKYFPFRYGISKKRSKSARMDEQINCACPFGKGFMINFFFLIFGKNVFAIICQIRKNFFWLFAFAEKFFQNCEFAIAY